MQFELLKTDGAARRGLHLVAPPVSLGPDNGARIAWAGLEHLAAGGDLPADDGLALIPRARWPLDPDAEQIVAGGRGRHRG